MTQDASKHGDASFLVVVGLCREGQAAAWRKLVRQHLPYVARLAHSMGIPGEEIDDVCQEVFVVVYRKLEAFTGGRFSTWLYRITANVVHRHHRRRRTRNAAVEWLSLRGPQRRVDTPEDVLRVASSREAVAQVLGLMAPKKREVFALYELEQLSGAEIAEHVGCSEATVRTRLFHARQDFLRIARKRGLLQTSEVEE